MTIKFWMRFLLIGLLIAPLAVTAGKKLPYNEKEKAFLKLVDLIITLKERKEFRKRLTTHHERARFMELFWAKRDDDLTDNINPFRIEWLARHDYVLTHFKDERFRQTHMNKSELFLLLGPPTRKSNMIDITLMGPGYRNRYTRYPPELWVYEKVGYDYKRRQLKVQFVATSAFGEYVAITDRLTDHWLRTLKFKFIVDEDLDEAPLMASGTRDYQGDVLELAGGPNEVLEQEPEEEAVPGPVTIETAAVPKLAAPPKTAPLTPVTPETKETAVAAVPMPAPDGESESALMPPASGTQAGTRETDLTVPTTTSIVAEKAPVFAYVEDAGNTAAMRAKMTWFKSGTDRRLMLGRIGFPLNSLKFTLSKKQYRAPFQLDYSILDSNGRIVHRDRIRTEVMLPSLRVLDRKDTFFSKEFAVILPGDRYTLRAQLDDLSTQTISYFEQKVEIPPMREEPHTTDMVLMDPNVNPDFAKFNIKGKPYNLRLTNNYQAGDRIYPVTELVNLKSQDEIDTIEVQAVRNGEVIHRWDLYSSEITDTNQSSFMLHPILNTQALEAGEYHIRIEVEMASGEILLSQSPVVIE